MAILKLGELVAGIRGTIGGTIYSANLGGPYARGWSKGPNPRSRYQTIERSYMSRMPSAWREISDDQRSDWDDYAALPAQELTNSLGEAYYASGFNWFSRINVHLLNADRATRQDPPDLGRPAIPTISDLAVNTPLTSDARFNITFPEGDFDGFDQIVYTSFAPSIGLLWLSHGYTCTWAAPTTFYSSNQIGLTVRTRFGDPTEGSKCFAMIHKQTTQGERSAPASITEIVY